MHIQHVTFVLTKVALLMLIYTVSVPQMHATCSCFIQPQPRMATIDISRAKEAQRLESAVLPRLLNNSSRVVMTRFGKQTSITMEVDYRGELTEFAMIIPVPTQITREHVSVIDPEVIERIDRASAPRLMEYHDPNPCRSWSLNESSPLSAGAGTRTDRSADLSSELKAQLPVRVTAEYNVGEYDITMLEAEDGSALFSWLKQEQYVLPEGARSVLDAYIKRNMQFFVAKVNLEEAANKKFRRLRPLQLRFNSDKFMLPVRLGTVNALNYQDLQLFVISQFGRVESSNYRTVEMPSDRLVPYDIRIDFAGFYSAVVSHQAANNDHRAIFTEYSDKVVVSYRTEDKSYYQHNSYLAQLGVPVKVLQNNFVLHLTRLRARYNAASFPEDIFLHETTDRSAFAVKYTSRKFTTATNLAVCQFTREYLENYFDYEYDAETALLELTAWDKNTIHQYRKTLPEWIENHRPNRSFLSRIWRGVVSWFGG